MEERRQRMTSCDLRIKAIWNERNIKFYKCMKSEYWTRRENILQKKGIKKIKNYENMRYDMHLK